jgi:hypothetical protein
MLKRNKFLQASKKHGFTRNNITDRLVSPGFTDKKFIELNKNLLEKKREIIRSINKLKKENNPQSKIRMEKLKQEYNSLERERYEFFVMNKYSNKEEKKIKQAFNFSEKLLSKLTFSQRVLKTQNLDYLELYNQYLKLLDFYKQERGLVKSIKDITKEDVDYLLYKTNQIRLEKEKRLKEKREAARKKVNLFKK